jgi:hypothetical protein
VQWSGCENDPTVSTNQSSIHPQEAVAWLKYTYMYVRMVKNPLAYGITYETLMVSHVSDRVMGGAC